MKVIDGAPAAHGQEVGDPLLDLFLGIAEG